jgi:murein DD-endopeptidase MepM/ murein hydrolase activator NlpD
VSTRSYAGRHRSAHSRRSTVRSVGFGLALPASAAATLVMADGSAATADPGQALFALTATSGKPTTDKAVAGAALAIDSRADGVLNEQSARSAVRAKDALLNQANAQRAAALKDQSTRTERVVSLLMTAEGAPGSHAWVKPVTGYSLTSGYGMRWGKLHPAQDFSVPPGTPVRAMSSGKVISAQWDGPFGQKVVIEYWDGTVSWFCHLSAYEIKPGDTVNAGQIVAKSGNTGHSTGPHLHLEVYPNEGGMSDTAPYGQGTVNPATWFSAKGINI